MSQQLYDDPIALRTYRGLRKDGLTAIQAIRTLELLGYKRKRAWIYISDKEKK